MQKGRTSLWVLFSFAICLAGCRKETARPEDPGKPAFVEDVHSSGKQKYEPIEGHENQSLPQESEAEPISISQTAVTQVDPLADHVPLPSLRPIVRAIDENDSQTAERGIDSVANLWLRRWQSLHPEMTAAGLVDGHMWLREGALLFYELVRKRAPALLRASQEGAVLEGMSSKELLGELLMIGAEVGSPYFEFFAASSGIVSEEVRCCIGAELLKLSASSALVGLAIMERVLDDYYADLYRRIDEPRVRDRLSYVDGRLSKAVMTVQEDRFQFLRSVDSKGVLKNELQVLLAQLHEDDVLKAVEILADVPELFVVAKGAYFLRVATLRKKHRAALAKIRRPKKFCKFLENDVGFPCMTGKHNIIWLDRGKLGGLLSVAVSRAAGASGYDASPEDFGAFSDALEGINKGKVPTEAQIEVMLPLFSAIAGEAPTAVAPPVAPAPRIPIVRYPLKNLPDPHVLRASHWTFWRMMEPELRSSGTSHLQGTRTGTLSPQLTDLTMKAATPFTSPFVSRRIPEVSFSLMCSWTDVPGSSRPAHRLTVSTGLWISPIRRKKVLPVSESARVEKTLIMSSLRPSHFQPSASRCMSSCMPAPLANCVLVEIARASACPTARRSCAGRTCAVGLADPV